MLKIGSGTPPACSVVGTLLKLRLRRHLPAPGFHSSRDFGVDLLVALHWQPDTSIVFQQSGVRSEFSLVKVHCIGLDLLQGALKEVQKIVLEPPKTRFRGHTGD